MSLNDRTVLAPDGTRIAYGVAGEGPALVLTNGLTTTEFFWKYLRPRWLRDYTVVTWDLPGHGVSDPPAFPEDARVEDMPALLARVMDAAGIDRAVHIGWSLGCQLVLEAARQIPERCAALVTLFGPAEHVLKQAKLPLPSAVMEFLLTNTPPAVLGSALALAGRNAPIMGLWARSVGLIGAGTGDADLFELIETLSRVDVPTAQAMVRSAQAHSAFDVLGQLRVPLLIVAGEKDGFAPAGTVALAMHRAARNSTLVSLPEGTHSALLDHAGEVYEAIAAFLADLTW